MTRIAADPELTALAALSARLGRDPRRTQAAGGNTSIKRDGALWIKASGLWLAQAQDEDIMVPVDLPSLRDALASGDPGVETITSFVVEAQNPRNLRPSIETSVHAVIPQTVVAHIHCVETIALAVRRDCQALVAARLSSLKDVVCVHVPYRRPGLPLAKAIAAALVPGANVFILGNHGLVVAGASVAEIEQRLALVCDALASPARPAPPADFDRLARAVQGSEYRLPQSTATHALALDDVSRSHGRGGALYPDHVIFLGPGVVEAESVAAGAAMRPAGGRDGPPLMLLIPGMGVVLHRSTTIAADAMAQCLADVAARIPAGAALLRLTPQEEFELTNWEAEKYRQALGAKSAAL